MGLGCKQPGRHLHHAVHAAHATHATRHAASRSVVFRRLGDHGLGRQHQAGDAGRVLQRGARHLVTDRRVPRAVTQ